MAAETAFITETDKRIQLGMNRYSTEPPIQSNPQTNNTLITCSEPHRCREQTIMMSEVLFTFLPIKELISDDLPTLG